MRRLGLLLLVVVTACSTGQPAETATGREIYTQLCSSCHGGSLEGRVGPPLGPGSNAAEQPDEFLEVTISNGRGRMPSFSSTLDQRQLTLLIEYLREEQRG